MTVKTFFAVIQIAVCIINWLRKKNETCSFVHTDRTLINVWLCFFAFWQNVCSVCDFAVSTWCWFQEGCDLIRSSRLSCPFCEWSMTVSLSMYESPLSRIMWNLLAPVCALIDLLAGWCNCRWLLLFMFVCVCVCVCVHACVHVYMVCMRAHVHMSLCVCMHASMYFAHIPAYSISVYICIHIEVLARRKNVSCV